MTDLQIVNSALLDSTRAFLKDVVTSLENDLKKNIVDHATDYMFKNHEDFNSFENKRSLDSFDESKSKKFKAAFENYDKNSLWTRTLQAQYKYTSCLNKSTFIQRTNCIELALGDEIQSVLNNNYEMSDSTMSTEAVCSGSDSCTESSEINNFDRSKMSNIGDQFENLRAKQLISLCCECANFNKDNLENIMCRFVGWRKLTIDDNNKITEAGFLELNDANEADNILWESTLKNSQESNESIELKVISLVGDDFENLFKIENRTRKIAEKKLTWKRMLENTRELCDKCLTTIFNGHFCCTKCGFSVCLSCYESRQEGVSEVDLDKTTSRNKDRFNWNFCSKFQITDYKFKSSRFKRHKPEDLIYVQFIPPYSESLTIYMKII